MMKIDSKITVQKLLANHPGAITAFIKAKMQCVGCPAQGFHTLEEVARIYGCTVEDLCLAIREAVEMKGKP